MSEATKQNLIMNYLPIVITIVAYIVGFAFVWGVQSTKISAQADELTDQKDKISTLESKLVDIQIKVERIDTNVEIIKNKLN